MEAVRALVEQYLRAAWRRRWIGAAVAWLFCGVGWVGVYLVPNQYESTARLFVDADAVLTPLLRGLAAELGPCRPARNASADLAQPTEPRETGLEDGPGPGRDQPIRPGTPPDRPGQRDPRDPADQEPVHHHLSQRQPQAGARRGADTADHLCRERDGHQPNRHGECPALPGASDLLIRTAVARCREAARGLPREIRGHPARQHGSECTLHGADGGDAERVARTRRQAPGRGRFSATRYARNSPTRHPCSWWKREA